VPWSSLTMSNFTFGTMNRLIILGALFFCVGCFNDSSTSADEKERPADWKADVELIVALDSLSNEFVELHVVSSKQSQPFSGLIDQVYDLAFSGDAEVYGATLFGEVDNESRLDPKALLESLEFFDTVYVEDLITGELKDTVVDLSFNKSAVTLFTVLFSISDDQSLELNPVMLSMGKQVFNEETGELRGFSDKFFLSVNDGDITGKGNFDKMIVSSDSLGAFGIRSFMIYHEETSKGLGESIREVYGTHPYYKMNFRFEFDYVDSKLLINNLVIRPLDQPELI